MAARMSVWLLILVQASYIASLPTEPPNIVFIVADDLGWGDVGWNRPQVLTPNLDRLANEGVILNSSYVQPVCSPSRSAFMTGYFPYHIGLQHGVIPHKAGYGVPLDLTFLPQRLKELGYDTHAVGKWHLGFCNWQYTPTLRGFDSFYGYYLGCQGYYSHRASNGFDFRFNREVVKDQVDRYSAYSYADRASTIIQEHNTSRPLFLYLPLQTIHYPYEVPGHYIARSCAKTYFRNQLICGMIAALDETVGNVTKALELNGMLENTLIVFTSDNGGFIQAGSSNFPLRGGKETVWEGGTKVPAFVWGNMLKKKRYRNTGMIHAVDWFPTFISLAGGKKEEGIDGVDQWKTISEDKPSARTEFVYNIDEEDDYAAIRSGDYKFMEGKIPCPCGSGFGGKHSHKGRQTFLFNIKDDPFERNDLSEEMPEMVEAMKKKVAVYKTTLHPPFPHQPSPSASPKRWNGVWSPGWC